MEPELKALIDEALARGASRQEVRKIMADYYGRKKKASTTVSGSALETEDSTAPTSSEAPSSQEIGGVSDTVPTVEIFNPFDKADVEAFNAQAQQTSFIYDGKQIDEEDANLIQTYTEAYQNSLDNYFSINFNADRYYEATGRPQAAQNWRNASAEQQRSMNASLLAGLKSKAGTDEEGNPRNPYSDEAIIDDLLKGSDAAYSGSLQTGEAESVGRLISMGGRGRGMAATASSGNPIFTAFGQEIIEGLESTAGLTEEQIQEKNRRFEESAVDQYNDRQRGAARARLMAAVNADTNDAVKGQVSADVLSDEEKVKQLERHLFEEYDIMADLNDTGYIGDTSEGRQVGLDFFRGLESEVVKLLGTAYVGIEDASVKAVEGLFGEWAYGRQVTDMHRRAYKQIEESIERRRAIPEVDPASKFENGDWEGGFKDVLADFGHSVPMMAAAITTQRMTGNSKLTAGVVSAMGSVTAYDIARDEEWFNKLNTVEQGGFVVGYGVAEGAPAFVGAKIFEKFRGLSASSKGTADFIRGMLMNTPLAMGEEALTEAVTGGMQYVIEQNAKKQDIDVVQFESAVKNGFYAGAIMGGGMATAGSSVGVLGLAASSIPAVQSKLVIRQLKKELDSQDTVSARRDVMARLVAAIQSDEREGKKRREFYDELRQADPEAYSTLIELQTQITKRAIEHGRTTNKSQRRRLRNEVNKLVKERGKLESKFDQTYDLNSRSVTNSIMGNVNSVLEEYNLDSLFEGRDSMSVTEGNVDSVLDRINNLLLDKLSLYMPLGLGRVSDPQQVADGLKNMTLAVRTLAKTKPGFKGIVIHRTPAAMANAVGADNLSRGLHIEDNADGYNIHLLVPAILENTAYHEAYHDLALEKLLGTDQLTGLALTLMKSLEGDGVLNKFNRYLARVLQSERVQAELAARGIKDPSKASMEELASSPVFADEFLAELLGDITAGSLDLEVKRGLVERFTDLINRGLDPVPFVGKLPKPAIADLGRAIERLTGRMAKGEGVIDERTDLQRAVERMRYASAVAQLQDDEDTEGKRRAVRGDVFEVQDAKQYADAMNAAIERMKALGRKEYMQVTGLSEKEVQEMMDDGARFFMTSDNNAGLYLNKDNYMGGLFRNPDSDLFGVSVPLMQLAEENGMALFDAFGSPTKLEQLYINNGYKPVARIDFDENIAPEGWDDADSPLRERPDLVFFVKGDGTVGEGGRQENWEAGYDFAVAASQGVKYQGRLESLTIPNDARITQYLEATNQTEEQMLALREELARPEILRQKRDPRVVQAIQNMKEGTMTQEEYIAVVREVMPIKPFNEVPAMPTLVDLGAALKSNQLKAGIYDLNKELPDGYFVGLRLDIPAYEVYDTWVVSVHEGSKIDANMRERRGQNSGKAIAYSQTGIIQNVTFGLERTSAAMKIGIGTRINPKGEVKSVPKSTVARMYGDWVNHDPSAVRAQAEAIMASEEYNKEYKEEGEQAGWIQVGMNPFRHSWFYDKRDGNPVASASEVIQIGALVLAKNTVKIRPDDDVFNTGTTTPDGRLIRYQGPLSEAMPDGEAPLNPKLVGQFAQSVKDKTIVGTRVGQGYVSNKSAPNRLDDDFILTREYVRETKPRVYIGQAAYLAQLDIVASVRKFRQSSFQGKNALKFADEVYDIYIREVKENLLFLHDQFDAELREVATLWYDGANIISQQLGEKFGLEPIQVAAAIAALSPQKDWYQNVRLAEVVLEAFVTNGSKPVTQEMVDYFNKEGKGAWARSLSEHIGTPINQLPAGNVRASAVWAYVDLNIDKSFDIITPSGERGAKKTTEDGSITTAAWGSLTMIDKAIKATTTVDQKEISKLLGQEHKIRHFFNNIHNPSFGSDATIDTHAVAAALLKPLAGASYEVLANFGSSNPFLKKGVMYDPGYVENLAKAAGIDTKSALTWKPWAAKKGFVELSLPRAKGAGISGNYFATLEAYREAAEERGLLPREMQSITWEAVRLLYTAGFKNSEANKTKIQALHTRYRNGEISKEQLRESLLKEAGGIGTPDWSTTVRDAVRQIGREQPESRNVDRSSGIDRRETTGGRGTSGSAGDVSGGRVKSQGDLTRMIADFLDREYSNPVIKRDRRRKNPVRLEASIGQLATMVYAKKDILKILMDMGMTEKAARETYNMAYSFKRGRLIGKMEAGKPLRRKLRKKSTEAKNLEKALTEMRDRSTNYREFLKEAIDLINERMKENGKTPFTNRQVQQLMRVAREAHKVSGKRLKEEGYEVMQTFIDKISAVFDARDSKQELQNYLDKLKGIKNLQKRLANAAKPRKAGEALKSTATYNKYAEALSKIDAALLEMSEVQDFEDTLNATLDSIKKPKVVKTEDGKEGVSFPKLPAEELAVRVADFQSKEDVGREAVMRAKAERLALKNKTTIDEEYAKLKKAYEVSRLSANRRNILRYMDDWNSKNPNDQLDSTNPAHIERVLEALYNEKVSQEEANTEMILDDVMLPRIAANLDMLLDEPMIADILGIYDPADFDLAKLRQRLLKLNRRQIAHLDYKLDDFIVNSSVFGLGYVHSLVRGSIDYAGQLADLKKKGLESRKKVYMGALDTVDSYLRMMFPTDNRTLAQLRRAIGFGSIEGAFGRADFRHAALVEKMEEKVLELQKKSGRSLTNTFENAIMQVFSMTRQVPMIDEETLPGQNEAEWFVNLKGVMQRTIAFHVSQQTTGGGAYSKSELDELQRAYDFLFEGTNSLKEIQDKVKAERPELVEFVDYMVDMHTGLVPQFSNYVERYLGKELVMEDNYTPFDVRVQTKNKEVNESMRMYEGFHKALQESSLGQGKRAAGSSFERNPRSLRGDKSVIGLNFLSINEATLRENVTLMETVGSTLAHRFVMNSAEAEALIENATVKSRLEGKIARYVHQDTGKVPIMFAKDFVLFGKRVENPAYIIRQAAIIKAFGGFFEQTLKQSNVLVNAFFQSKNPLRTFPYVMRTTAEMVFYSGKGLFMKDSKIALDNNGRYRLLQNSPVFSRDYEAGNIDPFTGSMNFDASNFQRATKYLNNLSIKNLKGTDKVVAIASWFGFYADSLIDQGVVNSVSEIDWEEQAVNPNKEALSYADSLVSKDQAASTPRQSADLYIGGKDFQSTLTYVLQNFLLPFSRFAVNKKRSIGSDFKKVAYGSLQAKREGVSGIVGSVVELATFHTVGKVLLPALYTAIFGDDEDQIKSEDKDKAWYDVLVSTLVDFSPLVPLAATDNLLRETLNKYLIFPMMEEDNFGIGDETYDERYERWKKVKGGVPVYGSLSNKQSRLQGILAMMGPYGQFISEMSNTFVNVESFASGSNKVTTATGREYFVRPEDRANMTMHYYMKMVIMGANLIGFGNKEFERYLKTIDNVPRNRALSSEEELAAYEAVAKAMSEDDKQFFDAVKAMRDGAGTERLQKLLKEAGTDPYLIQQATNRFSKGFDEPIAEKALRARFPDTYSKHIAELRNIGKRVQNSRDYYVLMRAKAKTMPAQEFKELDELAQVYFGMLAPAKIETSAYMQAVEE